MAGRAKGAQLAAVALSACDHCHAIPAAVAHAQCEGGKAILSSAEARGVQVGTSTVTWRASVCRPQLTALVWVCRGTYGDTRACGQRGAESEGTAAKQQVQERHHLHEHREVSTGARRRQQQERRHQRREQPGRTCSEAVEHLENTGRQNEQLWAGLVVSRGLPLPVVGCPGGTSRGILRPSIGRNAAHRR